jgi:hypothetical protein
MTLNPARAAVTVLATALMFALAGCTYRAGADNPAARSLSWFSYAGAGDIRAACLAGTADRLRLIYNGNYAEEVRSYDVAALAGGGGPDGGAIEVRVRGPQDLTRGVLLFDLFGPWRADGRLIRISANEWTDLHRALSDSGLARPAPDHLRLDSKEFYWLVSACLNGRFTVNAWKYPSPRFKALSFPAVLLRLDPTGTPLNPPQPANQFPDQATDRMVETGFVFEVHGNRLRGAGAAFGG